MSLDGDLTSLIVPFLLATIRFLGLLLSAPAFVAPSFPLPIRFWIATILALAAWPFLATPLPERALAGWGGVALAGAGELLVGITLGLLSALPLYALQVAGRVIGTQMGFGMVNVLDPFSQVQASLIGQIKFLLGLWYFFYWDGHLLLMRGLVESFRLLPLGGAGFALGADMELGRWLQDLFILSFRIVLPYFGTLLLADLGLGFVARTVPQMNIFVLGLPLKILLGFFLLVVVLPLTVDVLHGQIEGVLETALQGAVLWR